MSLKNLLQLILPPARHRLHKLVTLYEDIIGISSVNIISIREGSVVVDHQVVLQYSATNIKEVNNATHFIKEDLNKCIPILNASSIFINDYCYPVNKTITTTTSNITINSLDDLIDQVTCRENPQLEGQYVAIESNDNVKCFHRCLPIVGESQFVCDHGGYCQGESYGLKCLCPSDSNFWYEGKHCEIIISKWGLIGGLCAAIVLIIIIAIIFCIFLSRGQQGLYEKIYLKNPDVNLETCQSTIYSFANQRHSMDGNNCNQWADPCITDGGGNGFHLELMNVDTTKEVKLQRPKMMPGEDDLSH
uniref:Uncharacterized protein n=1 Tax=Eptatretus burgeri TaxID=7764 RepID=A0A8C4WYA1_EPTBU